MIKLQIASIEDVPTIAQLATVIWHEHFTPIIGVKQVEYMVEKFQSEKALLKQLDDGMVYVLFMIDNQAVGYFAYNTNDPKRAFLSKIYLLKEYRGNGALTLALEHIKETEVKKAYLTVNRHNQNTIDIYKKKGFMVIEEKCCDIGNDFVMDDYIMEKIF